MSLKDDALDFAFGVKFTIDKSPDFGSDSGIDLLEKLDALLKELQNALLTVISVLFVGIGYLFFD